MNSKVIVSCVMLLLMKVVHELFIELKNIHASMYYPTPNNFRHPKESVSETTFVHPIRSTSDKNNAKSY